eukprot:scaffold2585_cov368-Prasinococcus_capsulatus_cf.AAC.3
MVIQGATEARREGGGFEYGSAWGLACACGGCSTCNASSDTAIGVLMGRKSCVGIAAATFASCMIAPISSKLQV